MNLTSKLVGIPLLTWVFLCACAQAWKLDCTKFVFAPRCRGVAAKRGDTTSYLGGEKWTPDDTWLLFNRPSDLTEEMGNEINGQPEDMALPPTHKEGDKVVRLLSNVLGLSAERLPRYRSDRQTNQDRVKVYFDALLQSLEDTDEDVISRLKTA